MISRGSRPLSRTFRRSPADPTHDAPAAKSPNHSRKSRGKALLIFFLILVAPPALGAAWAGPAEASRPHYLGGHPLCEASAALWIPCPDDGTRTCLLVGDNELRHSLYAIPFDGHRLDVANRTCLNIKPLLSDEDEFQLSDIESLTVLGSGEVLVYGSHSRNKRCERSKKRRRYLGIRLENGAAVAGEVKLERTKKSFKLEDAFPPDAGGALKALRQAVKEAEEEAERLDEEMGDAECHFAESLNVEGAAAIPGPSGDEVWLGLRAPLVDGKAALIRHEKGLKKFSFDKARLVDLDGWAIRDLTYARGWIWGLAGPVPDDAVSLFKLWRFRVAELGGEGAIEVEYLTEVPNSAEGLAIWGDSAVVIMDGDQLKDPPDEPCVESGPEDMCKTDASYVVLRVPW